MSEPLCCTPVPGGGVCGHDIWRHKLQATHSPTYCRDCPCTGYTSPTAAACPDYGMTVTEAFRVAADIEAGKQPPTPPAPTSDGTRGLPRESGNSGRTVTITLTVEEAIETAEQMSSWLLAPDGIHQRVARKLRRALQQGGE